MQLKFTLTRNERDVEVTVTLEYTPASRGYRDKYGAPEEPDEPATYEIGACEDDQGNYYDLTDAEYDEIVEKAWKQHNEETPDYDEP